MIARDPLLVRVGRDLELTPRGRALIEPVRQMLLNAHAVLGSHALFDPSADQRTFTLLSPECVTLWLIRSILRRLQAWAPGIRIEEHGGLWFNDETFIISRRRP